MDFDSLLKRRAAELLTYDAYLDLMAAQAAAAAPAGAAEAGEWLEYTRLNLHRSRRIARTWRPSDELAAELDALPAGETWLVLSEPWCGDSAQCLPCVAVMASGRPGIDLRVLLRDANPDVMDRFLTDGKRAIPIVAMFDAAGRPVGRWGPRPAPAQALFAAATAEGLEKPRVLERLHLWYGRDRGRTLDAEFHALLAARRSGP